MSPDSGALSGDRRPPLKWAGGKRWLVPILSEMWEAHRSRTLVEPFCGGLAVSLGLQPANARLNDANQHLINFYKWVGRGFELNYPFANDEQSYYRSRDRFNQLISTGEESSAEAAALFYYLNRTGYNGLCRFNKSGLFNVPFGRYKRINYSRGFPQLRRVLRGWNFTAGDFQCVELDGAEFVYADPPYDVEFTSYSAGGFQWADQERLAEWLSKHDGPVVASNQATARVIHLYERCGFDVSFVEGPRRISSDGNRDPAREVLASRNL